MSKARRLSRNDERLLYSLSGGVCAYPGCTQQLVLEDTTKTVSIGDIAHVIPYGRRGPRADHRIRVGLSEKEVDSYKNTILLCKNHHAIVDKNPEKYPPELLYQWKRERENQIRQMTDRKTSVCLIHKAMGPPLDAVKTAADLNLTFVGLVPVQIQLDEQSCIEWNRAMDNNVAAFRELMTLREEMRGEVVTVLPLSPIPMLIHLGALVTDTIPVEILQYSRDTGLWVRENPQGTGEQMGMQVALKEANADVLVVSVSITGTVDRSDIAEVVPCTYDHLEMALASVGTEKVLYREDIISCKKQFRNHVEAALDRKRYTEIHLFYAGPAGLAVELGRCISHNRWPPVHTYHYCARRSPRYERAITI